MGEFQIYPVLYDNWLFIFPPKKEEKKKRRKVAKSVLSPFFSGLILNSTPNAKYILVLQSY